MPPKSKRKLNCERAREAKRKRNSGEGTSSSSVSEVRIGDDTSLSQLVAMPNDALDTDDEVVDPSFDLDSSVRCDTDHIVETFCEDWVCHLDRDDRVSLGLFLCFQLSRYLQLGETKAAELSGMVIGKSDKAVWE